MRSDKIGHIFDSYRAELKKLDLSWFEWQGRLVLSHADVERFKKKNEIFVRALKSFTRPGRRPRIRRFPLRTEATGAPISSRGVSDYPTFGCSRCG